MLCLKADTCPLLVDDALLTGDRSVKEVSGVDLDTGFIGVDLKVDSACGAVEVDGDFGDVTCCVKDPVVVITVTVPDLLVVGCDLV